MENKPNLPPHLRERLEQTFEKQWQYQQGAIFLKEDLIHAFRRNVAEFFYRKAYQQAYSDLMQELGPVVEALKSIQHTKTFGDNVYPAAEMMKSEAEEALKNLKERILHGNNT